jgi:hypothetical protein
MHLVSHLEGAGEEGLLLPCQCEEEAQEEEE